MSDLSSLKSEDDIPKQIELNLIFDYTTIIRRSGYKKYWKVHSSEVENDIFRLIVRPAYCKKSSKKYKLGSVNIPCTGFKRISDYHLGLNYRDSNNQLQTLIITTGKILSEGRSIRIKEVFITS